MNIAAKQLDGLYSVRSMGVHDTVNQLITIFKFLYFKEVHHVFLGCLLAIGISIAPRLMLILAWIFSERWDVVWQGAWLWPLLGIIFAPFTTIMYLLVWTPLGIQGWDWMWIFLGVFLNIMKWSQVANNRNYIPGYPQSKNSTGATPPAPAA